MLRTMLRSLSRWVLGAAGRAGQLVLDSDARLALAPRVLDAIDGRQTCDKGVGEGRIVGHLRVFDGGKASEGHIERADTGTDQGAAPRDVPFPNSPFSGGQDDALAMQRSRVMRGSGSNH